MPRTVLRRITLTDFRSYERVELVLEGRPVFLAGPNGAGKTNLLEAISLLIPGRGLRNASLGEIGRHEPSEERGRAWAVAADIEGPGGVIRVGTGLETPDAARRSVRVDGEPVAAGRLADIVRLVWLTPREDRLFLEGAADRRRFLDRLVFAGEPAHAVQVTAYERALRERMRVLAEPPADPAWLSALEARLAKAGAAVAVARAATVRALTGEIEGRAGRPFPQASLGLSGEWERLAGAGAGPEAIEAQLAPALAAGRARDAAAGRALVGPHRGDLVVTYAQKGRPAAESSTGEQKALILNLILAQAARLSRAESQPNPILLFDEVAAHLDASRRAALFEEIEALGLQAFLTGTDAQLFADLKGGAQGFSIDAGCLAPADEA
jgi:DNA replication and repair protein RecF